jgi:hypothetical protein
MTSHDCGCDNPEMYHHAIFIHTLELASLLGEFSIIQADPLIISNIVLA